MSYFFTLSWIPKSNICEDIEDDEEELCTPFDPFPTSDPVKKEDKNHQDTTIQNNSVTSAPKDHVNIPVFTASNEYERILPNSDRPRTLYDPKDSNTYRTHNQRDFEDRSSKYASAHHYQSDNKNNNYKILAHPDDSQRKFDSRKYDRVIREDTKWINRKPVDLNTPVAEKTFQPQIRTKPQIPSQPHQPHTQVVIEQKEISGFDIEAIKNQSEEMKERARRAELRKKEEEERIAAIAENATKQKLLEFDRKQAISNIKHENDRNQQNISYSIKQREPFVPKIIRVKAPPKQIPVQKLEEEIPSVSIDVPKIEKVETKNENIPEKLVLQSEEKVTLNDQQVENKQITPKSVSQKTKSINEYKNKPTYKKKAQVWQLRNPVPTLPLPVVEITPTPVEVTPSIQSSEVMSVENHPLPKIIYVKAPKTRKIDQLQIRNQMKRLLKKIK